MVAQLVPQRLMGFIMGSWFLTTAGANIIGGYVANMMAVPENVTDPLMSLKSTVVCSCRLVLRRLLSLF